MLAGQDGAKWALKFMIQTQDALDERTSPILFDQRTLYNHATGYSAGSADAAKNRYIQSAWRQLITLSDSSQDCRKASVAHLRSVKVILK